VVEERRLPGTEETGEDGDRQTAVTVFGVASVEANRGAVMAAGGRHTSISGGMVRGGATVPYMQSICKYRPPTATAQALGKATIIR
jgi:hypothetical protein